MHVTSTWCEFWMKKITYNHVYIEILCPVNTSNNRKYHVQEKAGVETVKTFFSGGVRVNKKRIDTLYNFNISV